MNKLIGLISALTLLLLCGAGFCLAQDDSFRRMADAADPYYTAGMKDITADQLWKELTDADSTQPYLISVCSLADDTVRGHIPGAHHWDPSDLIRYRDQLPRDKKIVVYCHNGQFSSSCTALLNLSGFDAYNLRFGLCGWTDDTAKIDTQDLWYRPSVGHQTLENKPRPMTAEYRFPKPKRAATEAVDLFCANIQPEISKPDSEQKLKSATDVYSNLEDSDTTNDWFVLFCGPESVYNTGHIPGAHLLDPSMLGSNEALKYLPPDRPIVVYCMDGHHSMQVITLLNALGYDAYSLKRGLGSISDADSLLGPYKWTAPAHSYPLVAGSLPVR